MPRICEVYPGICLATEEKTRKNLSQVSMKAFVTSTVGGGEWTALCVILLTPEERIPGIHWIGGRVG
jgi:hypothetical protein